MALAVELERDGGGHVADHDVAPRIDELSAEFSGRAKVVKVNIDDADQSAARYAVSAVPTLILFEDGEPVRRWVGVQSKMALGAALEQRLAAR